MQLTDWLKSWWSPRKPACRRSRQGKSGPHEAARARSAELLEQRMLPAVITVTSLADTIANDGQVTLREAIQAANTNTTVDGVTGSGADTIQFASSLTASGPATITLSGTQLAITSDINILGPGADRLTIDGNRASGIFKVDDSNPSLSSLRTVTISGLTLTGGQNNFGGAIESSENLTVRDSVITSNTAQSIGGGIASRIGTLTVMNSTISNNSAGDGGGIKSDNGTLTVVQSVITGNVADYRGGGIYCRYPVGATTISQSTISGNVTRRDDGFGGGLASYTQYYQQGTVAISQSTISLNSAGHGGGVAIYRAALTVSQSTIAGNTAKDPNGLREGGIGFSTYGTAAPKLTNTIVAGNTWNGQPSDLARGRNLSADSRNNLIGDPGTASGLLNDVNGNIVGVSDGAGGRTTLNLDSVLFPAPVSFNEALPIAPLVTGSPALNAGSNALIPADTFDRDGDGNTTEPVPFDERGSGYDRVLDGTVDLGAAEGVPGFVGVMVQATAFKAEEDGSGLLTFELQRSSSVGSVTVNFTVGGSAALNEDYTTSAFSGSTGSVTFADGSTRATITIDPTSDAVFENNETITLTLTSGAGYEVSLINTATATIANDETIVVDSLVDEDDGNRTPGHWSLREAIDLANSNIRPDTIVFAPSLTASGPATITLSGFLRINDDLVIQGSTDHGVTINGNNAVQLFEVEDRTSANKVVAFRNLTLTGGSSAQNGGAIDNGENLTLAACTITGNFAFLDGGAINNRHSGRLTIEQSTIVGNSANFHAGAIANRGSALIVRQSTIVGNSVLNNLFVNNSPGGGIFDYSRSAELTNTIIAGNTKGVSGVESDFEGSVLTSSSRNNLIGSPTTAGDLTNGTNGNIVGQASGSGRTRLNLASVLNPTLTYNGGPTKTLALVSGSPAIDAGDNNLIPADASDLDGDGNLTEALPFDQRGSGFSRILDGTVDVGAVEFGTTPTSVPVVTIAVSPASVAEDGSGHLVFTLTRDMTTGSLTVNFSLSGTATSGSDYVSDATNSVTFADGASTATITVDPAADFVSENDETVVLTVTSGTGYGVGAVSVATATILNDAPVASLSIAADSATKPEGNSGSTPFTFTVTRTGDTSGSASANFAVTGSGSSAANSSDFGGTLPSGTISFTAGETSKTITVNISGDTTVEPNEGFIVALSNVTGADLGTTSATGSIVNDDASLSIVPNSAQKIEGNSGVTPLTFTVTRTGSASGSASVTFAVTNGGFVAADAADFGGTMPSGSITFGAGETSKTITINATGDTSDEADEYVTVTLSNALGASLGTTTALGAIINDDAPLSVVVASAAKPEGNTGSTPFTFTVSRTGYSNIAASVSYAVSGTAVNAADATDFGGTFPSGSINFISGEVTKTITINVSGDTTIESEEGFTVTLSNVAGANLGTSSANGTILNDDGPASLSIAAADASKPEGNSGSTPFTFTVTRTGDTSGTASANFAITGSGNNAANAEDFGLSSDTNLVVNGSFEAGNTDFTSSYNLYSDGTLNEGYYAVTTSPALVHSGMGSFADQTPGSGTMMMVVNGWSVQQTVWQQTVSVLPNTTYQFTAFGASPNNVTPAPQLRFEVNGTDVGTFTVPPVNGQWTPFSVTWSSGAATSATLRIINVTTAGYGNDFALDDITFNTIASLPSGTVNFAAGETSRTITINVLGDSVAEGHESFTVSLSNPGAGATIGTAVASGTIRNDESRLIADWRFENGVAGDPATAVGAIQDSSGNGHHGTPVGGPLYRNAIGSEVGMELDAINDRIFVPDHPDFELTESLTLEAILRFDGTTGNTIIYNQIIFRGDDRGALDPYFLAVTLDGRLIFHVENQSGNASEVVSPARLPIGEFVHVAGTLDDQSGEQKLYVNGAVVASRTTAVRPFASLDASRIAGLGIGSVQSATYPQLFHGVIDEVRISDVSLEPSDFLGGGSPFLPALTTNDLANVLLDESGNLRIRDLAASGRADRLAVSFDADTQEIVIRDPQNILTSSIGAIVDAHEIRVARAEITGNGLHIELNGGADQLDLSGLPAGLLSVEVDGGDGNDTIIGHTGADLLLGGLGHDSIMGGAGNDTLLGGKGNDLLDGGAGDDSLHGQTQNDRLIGGDGHDTCDGGGGDDDIDGGTGNDYVLGSTGNDVIQGSDGRDKILGGVGHDSLKGNSGNDRINGGSGDDSIDGGAGDDFIEGQLGNDLLNGSSGNDTLLGGQDDDQLIGQSGHDRLEGGDGHDVAKGGEGNDTLLGGNGHDNLSGSIGDDFEDGDAGSDTVAGGDGNDSLAGGEDNDTIRGDAGDDLLDGGAGQDVISSDLADDILALDEDDELL